MNATVWQTGNAPLLDPEDSIEIQRFVATASQTLFNITEFTYTLASNALLVFKNGLALVRGVDYNETSTSSFTLTLPATANDIIFVVGFTQIENSLEEAEAAAAAAAAIALALNKLYLGAKAADPTLDNQGAALQDGALYFNTVTNTIKVYELASTTWYAGISSPTNLGITQKQANVVFNTQLVALVSVADADALTTSKITATMQKKVGDTLGDELEMDAFVVSGDCTTNGTIRFKARCVSGFASGTYTFNYAVQN